MSPNARKPVMVLAFSAIAFAGLLVSEGFVPVASIPVRGDVPTGGYGSTVGVNVGDVFTEPEARQRAMGEVRDKYEAGIRKCAGDVLMTQGEYDAVVDLAYNIGASKVCSFSIIPKFRAGRYADGCAAILTVDMFNGYHCRDPYNLKHVNGCRGVMNRRMKQFNTCKGG